MYPCERTDINNLSVLIDPLVTTLKLQSNGPSHTNTVTGTLAVTFGTASRGLGGAAACPGPSSLYQMQQPTHQQPVYRLRFIRCGTITAFGVWRVNITGLHYSVIIRWISTKPHSIIWSRCHFMYTILFNSALVYSHYCTMFTCIAFFGHTVFTSSDPFQLFCTSLNYLCSIPTIFILPATQLNW